VGAVAGLGALWLGFRAPLHEPKPVATVTFGPVEMVPEVEQSLDACTKLTSDLRDFYRELHSTMRDKCSDASAACRTATKAVEDQLSVHRDELPSITPASYSYTQGYIHVHVVNDGNATATELKVTVPQAKAIVVPTSDPKQSAVLPGEAAKLPNLGPTEAVDVRAFVTGYPEYSAKRVHLIHAGGVGSVEVKGLDNEYLPLYWFFGIVGGVITLIIVIGMARNAAAYKAGMQLTNALVTAMPDRETTIRAASMDWVRHRFEVHEKGPPRP